MFCRPGHRPQPALRSGPKAARPLLTPHALVPSDQGRQHAWWWPLRRCAGRAGPADAGQVPTFDFFGKLDPLGICQRFLLFFNTFKIQNFTNKLDYWLCFIKRRCRDWWREKRQKQERDTGLGRRGAPVLSSPSAKSTFGPWRRAQPGVGGSRLVTGCLIGLPVRGC